MADGAVTEVWYGQNRSKPMKLRSGDEMRESFLYFPQLPFVRIFGHQFHLPQCDKKIFIIHHEIQTKAAIAQSKPTLDHSQLHQWYLPLSLLICHCTYHYHYQIITPSKICFQNIVKIKPNFLLSPNAVHYLNRLFVPIHPNNTYNSAVNW